MMKVCYLFIVLSPATALGLPHIFAKGYPARLLLFSTKPTLAPPHPHLTPPPP